MGVASRKAKGRREPRFDIFPIPGFNLRLSSRDRTMPDDKPSRRAAARKQRDDDARAAARDEARGSARREAKPEPEPMPSKETGAAKGRSLFGRLVYWGIVLGLWGVIAGIGVFIWIAAHLPPIQ